MIKKVLMAGSLAVLAHTASAVYVGVNFGQVTGDLKTPYGLANQAHFGLKNMQGGVSLGHDFKISQFVSLDLELGYKAALDDARTVEFTNSLANKLKNTMYGDAHLRWHLSQAASLYGLVGFGQSKLDVDHWSSLSKSSHEVKLNGVRFGGGFDALLSKSLSIYGESVFTSFNDKKIAGIDNTNPVEGLVHATTVGLRYNF